MTEVYVLSGVLVALVVWLIWTYNRFVRDRNRIEEAWSGIDVQLKRRQDLIPSLVETVKGYADHESVLLEEVTEARSRSKKASGKRERSREESNLSSRISGLFALAEEYPEIKADKDFRQLQESIVEIEDDLQYSRRYYNGTVRDFNIRCRTFPSMLVAVLFGFTPDEYFEVSLATRETPHVDFEE